MGTREPLPLEELINRTMPAVVTIQAGSSRGSGFFVGPDTIVTNVHVVGHATGVTIRRQNGQTATAQVASLAPAYDIAVLKVVEPAGEQPTVRLGSTADVRIGTEVIAIGTPLGFLQNSVSRGIVSGLRQVRGVTLVQTDAAINPGNSGGPLLDRHGTVLGVVNSGYVGADGLAFAVAADHIHAVVEGRADLALGGTAAPAQPDQPADEGADPARSEASRAFEQAIVQLAQRADALDRQWSTFTAQCYQGPILGSFERPWFALWEPRAMQGAVASGCTAYFQDIRRHATEVQQAVVATDESARRADVYPGIRRDVLRRHRLDYWTR
jgi:S1-C subfamily serine protease